MSSSNYHNLNNNHHHQHHKNKSVMSKLSTLNPIPSLQSSFAQLGHSLDNNVNKTTSNANSGSNSSGVYNSNLKISQDSFYLLRPSTFIDIVHTLTGVAVRYGSLHFDDKRVHELNASNS